jgi:DNA replication protein DnaC
MERYIEKIINGETYLVKSPEWVAEQNRVLEEYRIKASNLPIHVQGLDLASYISTDRTIPRKLDIYICEFEKKFKNIHLYFWSHENGTQKTTMAGIVGNRLLQAGHTVQFVSMGDLVHHLQERQFDEELDPLVDLYKTCEFLIIDDAFDKRKATMYKSGWQISFLDQFLRHRLETVRLATCFTSNFAVNEIDENVFGTSVKKLVERSIPDPFQFTTLYQQRNKFNPNDLWS